MSDRETLKALFQTAIDSSEIATRDELLIRARSESLEVTRNGRDYMGFRLPDGTRFRVRFAFPDDIRSDTRVSRRAEPEASAVYPRAICIYVLHARNVSQGKKACYVGQTVDLCRRFREHLRGRPGRSSSGLVHWAMHEQVEIRTTILTRVEGGQGFATRCEGHWIKLATEAGYQLPDVERWGNLPRLYDLSGQAECWPESQIVDASRPLSDFTENTDFPEPLYTVRTETV